MTYSASMDWGRPVPEISTSQSTSVSGSIPAAYTLQDQLLSPWDSIRPLGTHYAVRKLTDLSVLYSNRRCVRLLWETLKEMRELK